MRRKEAALRRLKVNPKKLEQAADITSVLKDIPKGRLLAFKAMRFSGNLVLKKFLRKYYRIPKGDRNYVSIEAIALAVDIEPAYLLGELLLAMREYSVTSVKVIGIGRHPEVMQKTVENALLPGGVRDREIIHTMLGALPQKSGATFIDKFFAGESKSEKPESAEPERFEEDLDVIFPDVSVMQERVQPMRQKLLETRK